MPAVAVAAGLALWLQGGRFEETENAYVKAHMIAVTADVSGRVVEVGVRDNEPVAAGALLFRIDPAPFELAVARAEAQMAVVRTEVDGLRAEHRVALADAAEAAGAHRLPRAPARAAGEAQGARHGPRGELRRGAPQPRGGAPAAG